MNIEKRKTELHSILSPEKISHGGNVMIRKIFFITLISCLIFMGVVVLPGLSETKSTTGVSNCTMVDQDLGPISKVSICLQIAKDCIEKIKDNVIEGKQEKIRDLLKEYETIFEEIEGTTEQITSDTGLDRAIEAVSSATAKHLAILNDLLEKVPEKARDAILYAIEVSEHGRKVALERLQQIKERQEKRTKEKMEQREEKIKQEQEKKQERWQRQRGKNQNEPENINNDEEEQEHPAKPEKPERPKHPQNNEKPEHPGHSGKPFHSEKPHYSGKDGK